MFDDLKLAPKDEDEMEDFRDYDDESDDVESKLDNYEDDEADDDEEDLLIIPVAAPGAPAKPDLGAPMVVEVLVIEASDAPPARIPAKSAKKASPKPPAKKAAAPAKKAAAPAKKA